LSQALIHAPAATLSPLSQTGPASEGKATPIY